MGLMKNMHANLGAKEMGGSFVCFSSHSLIGSLDLLESVSFHSTLTCVFLLSYSFLRLAGHLLSRPFACSFVLCLLLVFVGVLREERMDLQVGECIAGEGGQQVGERQGTRIGCYGRTVCVIRLL